MLFESIADAKHIVIKCDNNSFCLSSALYTHILRLHKKVSLVCTESLESKLLFLPWSDKVRSQVSSSDLEIDIRNEKESLRKWFEEKEISLNVKMATALYADLLQEYKNFTSSRLNGTLFAYVKELIDAGAEYEKCKREMFESDALSLIRLRGVMYAKILLCNNAKAAIFYIGSKDLKVTGSTREDAINIAYEGLKIVNVELSILLDSDNENSIIKIIEEI